MNALVISIMVISPSTLLACPLTASRFDKLLVLAIPAFLTIYQSCHNHALPGKLELRFCACFSTCIYYCIFVTCIYYCIFVQPFLSSSQIFNSFHLHVFLLLNSFGAKHVTPRSLTARYLGNLVCLEGIVTKCELLCLFSSRPVYILFKFQFCVKT